MWIAWNTATLWALALLVFVFLARRSIRPRVIAASTGARELALVLGLYAVWRFVHELTVRQVSGAEQHGRWVWHLQRWMHLPSEASLQRLVLPHGWLVQFFNAYYAIAHGPALIIALVWLFALHREDYPAIRNSVAIVTGLCLVIRLFPVAPPRLLPDLGFVDTGLLYKQSVYGAGTGGMSNQLAAMPSIHVAWALIVTVAVITASRSRWRWLVLGHLVLTVLAVTVTANHWWLDGIVAAGLFWFAMVVQRRAANEEEPALAAAQLAPQVSPGSGNV
ncbi:MAG: inositol phosphorylceramide synthase [Acidimicrobiales bacterium]|nr:inositol phosphorylceramide synthase [Acidimicrobiales bacterium]